MSDNNAAKGKPGYKKAIGQDYFAAFNAAPPAPPDAELPWRIGGITDDPLSDDPVNKPPSAPDRHIRGLTTCGACGATFAGFNYTDAARCPNCTDADAITQGLTTPGTPWF